MSGSHLQQQEVIVAQLGAENRSGRFAVMTQKSGDNVAVEKRLDLASLLCMISRHGPAVAVAVLAAVSVAAAVLIYRNFRDRRRKATAADRARRAARRATEEPLNCAETAGGTAPSTDVNDASADVLIKEDADLRVRQRRVAACDPPSPPQSGVQDLDFSPTAARDQTATRRDADEEAGTRAEDVQRRDEPETDGSGVKCVTENHESISEHHQEAEKVLEAALDLLEEDLLCATVGVLSKTRPPNDDGQQDEAALARSLDEPVLRVEDVSVFCSQGDSVETDYGPESKADSDYCSHEGLSPDADDELVDDQCDEAKDKMWDPGEDLTDQVLQACEDGLPPGPELCVLGAAQQLKAETPTPGAAPDGADQDQRSDGGEDGEVVEDAQLNVTDVHLPSNEDDYAAAEWCHATFTSSAPLDETSVAAERPSSLDLLVVCPDQSAGVLQAEPLGVTAVTSGFCAVGSYGNCTPEDVSHPDPPALCRDQTGNIFDLSVAVAACDDSAPVVDVDQQEVVDHEAVSRSSPGFDTSAAAPGSALQDASNTLDEGVSSQHSQPEAQSGRVDDLSKSETPAPLCHDEASAANKDFFGHVVEDAYGRDSDRVLPHAVSLDVPKLADVCKSTAAKYENTEISIMEATMDTNEWITDGGNPTLPWMKPSVTQSPPKIHGLERQHESREPLKDITPAGEAVHIGTLGLAEETAPAVQPLHRRVNVTFRIHYRVYSPFQRVAVTGNQPELGSWRDYFLLEHVADGYWSGTASLPADKRVEFKFVVVDGEEVCRWEECDNRLLDVASGDDLHVHRWWGFL